MSQGDCDDSCLDEAQTVIVSVPVAMLAAQPAGPIILRTANPQALVSRVREEDVERIAYIQIADLAADLRPLVEWNCFLPVDVVVTCPDTAPGHLYQLVDLVRICPVRVSVPVSAGFLQVVRLAASLHCAVKLQTGQPDPPVVDELLAAFEFYLHGAGVTEPIEFFHTALMARFHGMRYSLWDIQEDNPAAWRFLTDEGSATAPGRLAHLALSDVLTADGECHAAYLSAHPDCAQCPHRQPCGGYFKWPNPDYACNGVKEIFERIDSASDRLKDDVADHARSRKAHGRE